METLTDSTSSPPHLVEPEKSRYAKRTGKPQERPRAPFFGPLPTRGVWTAVGLTRSQFLSILAVSIFLFMFLFGPVWLHTHDSHFGRIVWSYLIIVPMTWVALYRNGKARIGAVVAASVVVALVKLVVTAVILVAIGLGQA